MMKRFVSLGLAATFLVAVMAISFPSSGNAQSAGLVSSVLNSMQRNQKSMKSLRANISMEKYNSQLRDSDKYYGVVLYIPGVGRNAFVRIEWQSPQHEIVTVQKGQYMAYRPRLNIVYYGNTNSSHNKAGSALELMNMSSAQLQTRFEQIQDAREETLWGGVKTTHLKVFPKGAASYKYAEVWVDEGGMPVQTKVVEKNDDATTVRLTNMQKNAPISMDEFNLKLDSSVKKVKG
jgi:outer membrane lipoprotein-sorting protein